MTIQTLDLAFPALTSQNIPLALKNGDVPVNLTGKSVLFKAAPQPSSEAVVQKSENSGISIPIPTNGVIGISIGVSDFQEGGVFFWTVDVQEGNPVNQRTRYYQGRIVISPSPAPQA